jgi:hypothetical protein
MLLEVFYLDVNATYLYITSFFVVWNWSYLFGSTEERENWKNFSLGCMEERDTSIWVYNSGKSNMPLWKATEVSEEHVASIFRVEE